MNFIQFNLMHDAAPPRRRGLAPPARFSACGFTMLEMLVVLAILAALTMVAVQSLGPVEQQARSQATRRTLDAVKAAVLNVNQTGGTTVVGGFAADTGTLPNTTSAATFINDLAFNNGPAYPGFGVSDGQGGQYGWRGPYLQTALTSTQLVDGWNQPLSVCFTDSSGNLTTTLANPADRMVIFAGSLPITPTTLETSLAYTSLTAWPLTVRMYAVDTSNNRVTVTGTGIAALQGGIDPIHGTLAVTQTNGIATSGGTDLVCQFTPTPASLLVGNRLLTVTFTSETMSNFSLIPSPQYFHLNLIPGTSPSIDVLVARKTGT